MNQILLPIKPKYSQAILRGEKTFELRRRIPKRRIEKVFIYETAPTMKIVGWFEVEKILTYNIKKLWKETKEKNLINWDEFQSYFSSLEFGNAYKIKKVKKYERAHTLKKYDIKFHPQNFIYINSKPATMK